MFNIFENIPQFWEIETIVQLQNTLYAQKYIK